MQDIVAEWLRRWIANPLLFERASSNLADVDSFFAHVQTRTCTHLIPLDVINQLTYYQMI